MTDGYRSEYGQGRREWRWRCAQMGNRASSVEQAESFAIFGLNLEATPAKVKNGKKFR